MHRKKRCVILLSRKPSWQCRGISLQRMDIFEILKQKLQMHKRDRQQIQRGKVENLTQVIELPNKEPEQANEQPTLEGQKPVEEIDIKNNELQPPSQSNPKVEAAKQDYEKVQNNPEAKAKAYQDLIELMQIWE